MPAPWTRYLKFILTRTIVLYLACVLLVWHILDYPQLIGNAIPVTMSRLTPPIDYFTEFVDRQDHYDRFKLMDCVYYHKAVAHFFAFQKAEAFGMLGFCYDRLGERAQAIDSYRQSISLNPDYFWPYYDLGVIYYNQAQYSRAADYFQQAIDQNPVKTIVLLSRSKIYTDVKLSEQTGSYDFLQGLRQGRIQAYALMMECFTKTGSYEQLGKAAVEGLKEGLGMNGIFYYYAGLAAFYQKSFPNAMVFLQAAAQNDPYNADAYYYLSLCLRMAGKEDMSRALLAKAAGVHQQGDSQLKEYLKARVRFF
jgi:tetratricopeptide (TPR) repeat protein